MVNPLNSHVSTLDKIAYAFMAVVILVGMGIAYFNEDLFRHVYVVEDGVLEYFTSAMLFCAAMLSLWRLLFVRQGKGRWFIVTTGLSFLLMFFGAGEEISWGQRIFNVESSEFFTSNNAQQETNLHNMRVNGVNMNKLVFGKMLTLFLVLYYLVLPSVYARSARVQQVFDRLYMPVPKRHHGVVALIAGLAITLVASSKQGELNEVCLSVVFFITLYGPLNLHIYNKTAA